MIKYEENLAARLNGNNLQPLAGALVTVTDKATNLPAALYQDDELTPIAQPLTTDNNGYFAFKAADGKYTLTFSAGANSSRFDTFTREIVLEDPADNPFMSKQELALASGAAKVGFIQSGTGAVARTVQDKLRERMMLTDYGGIVADGTDQTANIIAWLGTLPADYTGMLITPNGLRFNADQVYDALPVRAILRDDSAINAWDTAGSRARVIGWAERGDMTAVTDLTNVIASSGHNASTGLDNRGTAGSNSANALVAAFHWFSGRLKKGQPGQRQLSRWEWAKIDGQQKWAWLIRKFVPWAAKNWEYWYPSTSYAAGATILSNAGRLYKTTAGGTTGATEPTHTSGTASDGGVSWEYMTSDHDSTIFAVGENGEIATNTAPVPGVMAYFKASTESPGAAIVIAEASGSSSAVECRLSPTDGAGGVVPGPRLRATAGSMALVGSDYIRTGFVASDARGVELASYGHVEIVAAAGDTTPSVLNCGLLVLANQSATSVTTLDDGAATQEVTLFFENANTTLVHNGGGFLLKGGVNVTPPTNSMLVMKRYSRSGAWFEKTRSF